MKRLLLVFVVSMLALSSLQTSVFASKTFLCTGGVFKKNIEDYGGQCVNYVRYETGISYDGCNNEAKTCFSKAQKAGYTTGQSPKIGSIMVIDGWGSNSAGHVGIVVDKSNNDQEIKLRHSNWCENNCETVSEDWIDVSQYSVLGYIYCDGDGGDSNQITKTFRIVNETGWYPPTKTCVNADEWVRIMDGRAIQSFPDNNICYTEYLRTYGFETVLIGDGDLPMECTQ